MGVDVVPEGGVDRVERAGPLVQVGLMFFRRIKRRVRPIGPRIPGRRTGSANFGKSSMVVIVKSKALEDVSSLQKHPGISR